MKTNKQTNKQTLIFILLNKFIPVAENSFLQINIYSYFGEVYEK